MRSGLERGQDPVQYSTLGLVQYTAMGLVEDALLYTLGISELMARLLRWV